MGETDPDVVRWGLHVLDVNQIIASNSHGDSNQHEVNIAREQSVKDRNSDADCSKVENEESTAHSLPEEPSQVSVAEASHLIYTGERPLQASASGNDWHSPSATNLYSGIGETAGHEGGESEAIDLGLSSSCSSPGDKSYDGEEYSHSLDLSEGSALDGEVGKWLNQMSSVPHVPRINGDIPSIDEATSDHQRLLDRLQLYDLVEAKVQGDGNCQFRALSDQIYRSVEHHNAVREKVVNQLRSHPDIYEGYVPMAYSDYLKKMSKKGEWGDHVTLQAAADSYGVKFFVLTSFKDTCYIEILPKVQKSARVILLSFWAEVHYNSIYLQGDIVPYDSKRKRRWRWWLLGI